MKHELNSPSSRSFCDQLFDAISLEIPELRRNKAVSSCSLAEQGRACFAFVYHQTRGPNVTIWCLGEAKNLQNAAVGSTLNMLSRRDLTKKVGWQARFPCSFIISSQSQVADAVRILNDVSHKQTADAQKVRAKNVITSISLAEEVLDATRYVEGTVTQIVVNSYERSAEARLKCIRKHGPRCGVCKFDFEAVYGDAGRDYIHVHHLTPLSQIRQGYNVNPIKDMIPVCPNCHSIIHRKTPPYTVKEVQAMMQNAKRE